MEIRTKRLWQIGCLALLCLLLTAFCLYPQYENHASAALVFPESSALPELHLPEGERIKGWEKEGVVYFFLPSYADLRRLSLGSGLAWPEAEPAETDMQYDVIQDILFTREKDAAPSPFKICFKRSANLYTIYMDLKGNAAEDITKQDFTETEIVAVSPDGKVRFQADDALVKGRGNSTWDVEKKPYYLKLSEKAGLCGMEPGKKWLLLANAYEATKLSNKLLYDFSKTAGLRYAADSQWADLYINGEYRGNYLVCEKIDVDEHIVDITDLEKENEKIYGSYEPYAEESIRGYVTDQSPANISGGYLVEKDTTIADSPCGFVTNGQRSFVVTSPDNASLEEVAYIRDCFQNIENLLANQDERLLQYIDADSFARRYLIEELALNSDAFITSCYYYKEQNDGKIYAGPVWDYDSVFGESDVIDYEALGNVWQNYEETTVLSMNKYRATIAVLDWEADFQSIPAYLDAVEKVYRQMLPQLETLLYEQIDAAAAHVRQSVLLDSIRWNYADYQAGHYASFENNVRYIKFFLAKRIQFLNRRFDMEAFAYTDSTAASHEITCITNDGETKITVKDSTLLKTDLLPEYDEEKYAGWFYEWDRTPVSGYLPVYEDTTLYLQPL